MYSIRKTKEYARAFEKLDKTVQQRINKFVNDRLAKYDDPKILGTKLVAYENLYRWRIGNYRIIGKIYENEIIILLVNIGHRGSIYENL